MIVSFIFIYKNFDFKFLLCNCFVLEWTSPLVGDFGKLIIYSMRDNVIDSDPFIPGTKALSSILTFNNPS